jgi:hypothetical protein
MQSSDLFPRTGKDVTSGFWSSYERVAKQHDDEFLDRQNGEMDALLIFVCITSIFPSHSEMEASRDTLGWSFLLRQLCVHCEHDIQPESPAE